MQVAEKVSKKQAVSNRTDCHRSKRMVCNLQGGVVQNGTRIDQGNSGKNTRYTYSTQASACAPRIGRSAHGRHTGLREVADSEAMAWRSPFFFTIMFLLTSITFLL